MEKDYLLARTYQEREALKLEPIKNVLNFISLSDFDNCLDDIVEYKNSAVRQKADLFNSFNFRQPDLTDFASIKNLEESRRINLVISIGVVAANMMGITNQSDNPLIFKANIYDGYYDLFEQCVKEKNDNMAQRIYLAAEENVNNLFLYWNNVFNQIIKLSKN